MSAPTWTTVSLVGAVILIVFLAVGVGILARHPPATPAARNVVHGVARLVDQEPVVVFQTRTGTFELTTITTEHPACTTLTYQRLAEPSTLTVPVCDGRLDLSPLTTVTKDWALVTADTDATLFLSPPRTGPWWAVPWTWFPLDVQRGSSTAATAATAFALRLKPSPRTPWTQAVVDWGRWHSLLPSAAAGQAPVQLRAECVTHEAFWSGATAPIVVHQYTTVPSPRDEALATALGLQTSSTVFLGCALGQSNRTQLAIRDSGHLPDKTTPCMGYVYRP